MVIIAIIAAGMDVGLAGRLADTLKGAMGSGVAKVLTQNGVRVLTNLDNRSEATRRRAHDSGMVDASLREIASTADFMLSILPPHDAFAFAEKFLQESAEISRSADFETPVFIEANATSPATVKRISELFISPTSWKFVDASIIGGPPQSDYNPTIYASADDTAVLDRFVELSKYGLKISALKGEGAGIGDASALKMSYAGITKGTTGLFATMILAAHQSSPATADALLRELGESQPMFLKRLVGVIPSMVPKAYRFVGEMEEIAGFVGEGEGDIYHGLGQLYSRIAQSDSGDKADVNVLAKFVEEGKKRVE